MAKKQKPVSKLTFQEAIDQCKVATGKTPEEVAEMVDGFRKAGGGMGAAWKAFVKAFHEAPKEDS